MEIYNKNNGGQISTSYKFDKVAHIYNTAVFQFFYFFAHGACLKFLQPYIKDNFNILDIACGTGIFLKKISKKNNSTKLFGIDNSKKMISVANKIPSNITFKVADAESLPFDDNSFDLITVIDAFYYFQNKEKVLKECFRILKPNCQLFIFYPAADILPKFIFNLVKITSKSLFFNLEEYSEFISIKALEKLADSAGLTIVKKKIKILHRFILFKKYV